jgi:ribosomal protein L25 (general stress protein Ctc)
MDAVVRTETYKLYIIEIIRTHDNHWQARVARSDGQPIRVLYGPKDDVPSITTNAQYTEQGAIEESG